jgi:hypothetical protein
MLISDCEDRTGEREKGRDPVTIKDELIARVSIQISAFRDFAVADPYGEIRGQGGARRPSRQFR